MPVISHPARHNRAAKSPGFWLLWLWLLWLGSDLMAVIIICRFWVLPRRAPRFLSPRRRRRRRADSSHSLCTNTNASTKHQAERQDQAGSSSIRPPGWVSPLLASGSCWHHGLSPAAAKIPKPAAQKTQQQQHQAPTQAASTSTKQSKSKPVAAQSGASGFCLAGRQNL
jgi:hypothetical protein